MTRADTGPRQLRILHVDDDADTREIVAITMEIFGTVELLQFASGREALGQARAFRPDVVLLDYMMPEMTGPDILAQLRTMPELSDATVIFMTGRSDDGDIGMMRETGAASVIVKPFEPSELLGMIEAALPATPRGAAE